MSRSRAVPRGRNGSFFAQKRFSGCVGRTALRFGERPKSQDPLNGKFADIPVSGTRAGGLLRMKNVRLRFHAD